MKTFTFLLLLLNFSASAQKINKNFTAQNITAGQLPTGQRIAGVKYDFPYKVLSYNLDTLTNELILVLKNVKGGSNIDGYVALFDLTTRQVRWSHEIFGGNFSFIVGADRVIQNAPMQMVCYDKHTGEKLWENSGYMDLGDIATVETVDDNTTIFSAGGVYFMNLADSNRHAVYNTKKNHTAAKLAAYTVVNAAGLTLGMLTGVFVFAIPYSSTYLRNFSNVATDGDNAYFASTEYLYCINTKKAKEEWMQQLPFNPTNSSTLWLKGDTIVMMHNGFVISTTEGMISKGSPYIAAFDKKTGSRHYGETFSSGKLLFSNGLYGSTLLAFGKQYIYAFDAHTGKLQCSASVKKTGIQKYKNILPPDSSYIQTADGSYRTLEATYPGERFLTDGEASVRLNTMLQPIGQLKEEIWQLYYMYKEYTFIRRNGLTLLLKQGKPIITLNIDNAFIYGNTLIDIGKSDIQVIDIASL